MIIIFIVALILSYLVGAIPFGLLFSRAVGKDVRREGSGNIGATNVNRVLGKKLGVLTLFCDIAKGFFPVYLISVFLPEVPERVFFISLCGLATVVGHMFPVYLRFKGGKGVATALGVFLFFSPFSILVALFVFIAVVVLSGFVSAGSLAVSALIPLLFWYFGVEDSIIVITGVIAGLIWVKHSSNIGRLLRGEEKSWKTGKSA